MTLDLQALLATLSRLRETSVGYPLNLSPPDWSPLFPFLQLGPINNLGDPFVGGAYGLSTFPVEREVVNFVADLFHLSNGRWGYVTSCGSEGNLRGLSFGRMRYPAAPIYASEKAHYSVDKAASLMGAPLVKVKADGKHRLCVADLRRRLTAGKPAVVCLTAGTTMAGAIDPVADVLELLRDYGIPAYIHVDSALFGLLTPFLENPPVYDFRLNIDSISVSGHKMLGCPIPCGVFVCREESVTRTEVEYIGSADTTIGGSRSGWSALAVAYALEHYGPRGLEELARRCVAVAEFATRSLVEVGWPAWKNEHSNVVVLARPPEAVTRRWQLATDQGFAHLVTMPHVGESLVKQFVRELVESVKEKHPCVTC